VTDVRRRVGGQSLVEFALILPVLLSILGAAVDLSRVFGASLTLQAATRNAAEYAASYATTTSQATSEARRVVCAETSSACTAPTVTVTAFSLSTTAAGASSTYPIATVTIRTTIPFRTLFAYPFFTQNGAWTLSSTSTFAIVQGRK
jgi:Flp pilus assembly protein TadG